MKNISETFELVNGCKIPSIGFGTWRLSDGYEVISAVSKALECGYRHIDTAAAYRNENGVGEAIGRSGIDRSELFVTSKLWNTERGYRKTLQAFELTMQNLGLDYLDLYLIHWPASESQYKNWDELNLDTWRAMTELYEQGRVKAIGVSNFMEHHLDSLMKTPVKPMVNQIEYHPGYMHNEVVDYCCRNNMLVEAWSPLGESRVLNNEVLCCIAEKYGKSPAQISIRWCIQSGVVPLPKSVTPVRISENFDVFDFEISSDDMCTINSISEFAFSGHHPDKVDF